MPGSATVLRSGHRDRGGGRAARVSELGASGVNDHHRGNMGEAERVGLNAPGPFYTAEGQCMMCGAPEAEAPDLMAFDEARGTCYFRRQPATPEETVRAVHAVAVACCDGVRYAGSDPMILQELQRLDPHRFPSPERRRQPWEHPRPRGGA